MNHSSSSQSDQNEDKFISNCFYRTKHTIKLLDKPHKYFPQQLVLSLHLAHNFTYLVQTSLRKIQHYSQNSHKLYQKQFSKLITSIFMVDSKNVIVLLKSMNQEPQQIFCLNLQTYEQNSLLFMRQFKEFCGGEIFLESGMVCVKEHDTKQTRINREYHLCQKIKFSYYKYIKSETKIEIQKNPQYVGYFNSQQYDLEIKRKVIKLNNKSMMGLIPDKAFRSDKINLFVYAPELNSKNFKNYVFCAGLKLQKMGFILNIVGIWESSPDIFYVKCQTYHDGSNQNLEVLQTQYQQIKTMQKSYEYVWPYKKTSKKPAQISKIIPSRSTHYTHFRGQQLNLTLTKQLKEYIYRSRIKRIGEGKVGYWGYTIDQIELRKWKQSQPSQYQFPIYYINNSLNKNQCGFELQKYKILQKNQKPNAHHTRILSVSYNPSLFLQFYEEYIQEQQKYQLNIDLKVLKQLKFSSKIITTYFLTQIIQKCDEDLLFYTVNILCQNENQFNYHQFD